MYGCQQILIKTDKDTKAILEFLCTESAKLSNCGIYYARQLYFKTGKIPNRAELHKKLGTEHQNKHFKAFYSQTAQQILTTVAESFKSYIGLVKAFKKRTITDKPRLPKYRKGGMCLVTYTGKSVTLKNELLRFPLGKTIKAWFGVEDFYLPMPSNLDYKSIKEYRILPRNNCLYLELVYQTPEIQSNVNSVNALAIDHGMDNWLTCLSNVGTSFIIDGRHLKSINQSYNKKVSTLMNGKSNGFWSKRLANLTEKRNRTMRDAINKTAKKIINHCLASWREAPHCIFRLKSLTKSVWDESPYLFYCTKRKLLLR